MNNNTKASPMSRVRIRNITNAIKKQFDVPTDKPFPIVKFLEYALVGIGFNYRVLPDNAMRGVYAEAIPEKGLLLISEATYNGACAGVPRDKFTIAHEIGHLLMHTPDRVIFARSANKIESFVDPEWQANTFAGELLVHTDSINGLSIGDIANKYKVSFTVATIQKEKAPRAIPA